MSQFRGDLNKVALNESDIVHILTCSKQNTVLSDTEYFENLAQKATAATDIL